MQPHADELGPFVMQLNEDRRAGCIETQSLTVLPLLLVLLSH